MALPKSREDREQGKFVETSPGVYAVRTTATMSGDINVDSTSVSTSGLTGKSSGGDFATAYTAATTITVSGLPGYHSTFISDDIVTILQIATDGSVTNTFSRDDQIMTVAAGVITVGAAAFVASDTFVVYTNISRQAEQFAANAPQAQGTDAAGADAYATVVTATADRQHMLVTLQGSNDAIVSLDSGTTDHFYITAGTSHVFDGVLIADTATVQGKNADAGLNYTNLSITIW